MLCGCWNDGWISSIPFGIFASINHKHEQGILDEQGVYIKCSLKRNEIDGCVTDWKYLYAYTMMKHHWARDGVQCVHAHKLISINS